MASAQPAPSILASIAEKLGQARFIQDSDIAYDVVFVLNVTSRGWILEKICKVIAEQSGLHVTLVYSEISDRVTVPLPRARAYFFSHYKLFVGSLARHVQVAEALRFVWFTHPDFDKFTEEEVVFALKHATRVFTANASHRDYLASLGVEKDRIQTILGGADAGLFQPKARGRGVVAFVGACYERKNPDLMLEVVRGMPDCRFMLLGPSADEVENRMLLWSNWPRARELTELPNLELVEARYEEYPGLYQNIDVFVSLSKLEGGPIALIEAMFANAVPVVTRTGFAEDLVRDGQNGFLLGIECSVEEAIQAVRSALADRETDIRATCEPYSWEEFGRRISAHLLPALSRGDWVRFNQLENCVRYLREGWNRREPAGCTMWGPRARLEIAIDSARPESASSTLAAFSSLSLKFTLKSVPGVERVLVKMQVNESPALERELAAGAVHILTCSGPFAKPSAKLHSVWLELEPAGAEGVPQLRLEALAFDMSLEKLADPRELLPEDESLAATGEAARSLGGLMQRSRGKPGAEPGEPDAAHPPERSAFQSVQKPVEADRRTSPTWSIRRRF